MKDMKQKLKRVKQKAESDDLLDASTASALNDAANMKNEQVLGGIIHHPTTYFFTLLCIAENEKQFQKQARTLLLPRHHIFLSTLRAHSMCLQQMANQDAILDDIHVASSELHVRSHHFIAGGCCITEHTAPLWVTVASPNTVSLLPP